MDMLTDWVDRLEQRRHAMKLNQEQMAERIGVTVGAYNHWVSRKRVPDKLDMFEKIAAAIDRSPAWLLYGAYATASSDPISRALKAMENMSPEDRALAAALIDQVAKKK